MDLIMSNYSFKSMTEQANGIKENLISPVKLLEEFSEKISTEKTSSQIFTDVYFNEALDEAKKSEFIQINNRRSRVVDDNNTHSCNCNNLTKIEIFLLLFTSFFLGITSYFVVVLL